MKSSLPLNHYLPLQSHDIRGHDEIRTRDLQGSDVAPNCSQPPLQQLLANCNDIGSFMNVKLIFTITLYFPKRSIYFSIHRPQKK